MVFNRYRKHSLSLIQRDFEGQFDIMLPAIFRDQAIPYEGCTALIWRRFQAGKQLFFAIDRVVSPLFVQRQQ